MKALKKDGISEKAKQEIERLKSKLKHDENELSPKAKAVIAKLEAKRKKNKEMLEKERAKNKSQIERLAKEKSKQESESKAKRAKKLDAAKSAAKDKANKSKKSGSETKETTADLSKELKDLKKKLAEGDTKGAKNILEALKGKMVNDGDKKGPHWKRLHGIRMKVNKKDKKTENKTERDLDWERAALELKMKHSSHALEKAEMKEINKLKPGILKSLIEEYNFDPPLETEVSSTQITGSNRVAPSKIVTFPSPHSHSSIFFFNSRTVLSVVIFFLSIISVSFAASKYRQASNQEAELQVLFLCHENEL